MHSGSKDRRHCMTLFQQGWDYSRMEMETMKKTNRQKGLKTQIVIYYVIASVVTVMLIGFFLYFSISSVLLNEKLSSTTMAVNKSGTYIEAYVDKVKDMSYVIANNPSTVRYLSGESQTEEAKAEDKKAVMNMIGSTIEADSSIVSIIIVGKKGQLVSNEASLDMSMSEDMMKEQWYLDAIGADAMPVLTSARMQKFNMDKDHWVVSLSRELVDDDGNNIGVMVMDLKYSVLDNYLSDLNLGEDGYAFILNNNDEVVYHKDTVYFEEPDMCTELVAVSQMETGYDSRNNLLYHEYELNGTNWTLSGVASLDGLLAIRRQLLETILVVAVISLVLMMMMVRKIRILMLDVSDQERAIRAYELNVLHSQINPHFLYNTLDTIVWMAEFGNSEKVVEVTKSLARFFRLSLSGGEEITTIERELDHVRQYLFIQKERYKDKLIYTIEGDGALSDVKIPKLLLQPVVENAIYHGIRDKEGAGHITIKVNEEGDLIVMTVEDDGVGFDTKILSEQKNDREIKLGGVGVANVDQRLKLAYGEACGVTVESAPGVGTRVILSLGKVMKKSYNG